MAITDKFTLEEIYLVKTCNTHDKDMAFLLLQTYLSHVPWQMSKTILHLLDKLEVLTDEEFAEIVSFPVSV